MATHHSFICRAPFLHLPCVSHLEAPVELDGEAEVSDAARSILLDQDVLALQVSMGDGRFTLCAVNFSVKVTEAARRRVRQPQQHLRIQRGQLQVVVQRAVLMVIGDEEELCERTRALNVSRNEACGRNQIKTDKLSSRILTIVCPVATPD